MNSKPDPAPIEIGKGMLFGFVCSIPLWLMVFQEFYKPILHFISGSAPAN